MDAENEDGRWLTYAELAELRGISKPSATRMSFRHKWRRQGGNDGAVRVFVPASALHDKPQGSDMARMTTAMEHAMDLFRQQVEAEKARADRAEARADRAEAGREAADRRLDQERARAERAEAASKQAAQAAEELRMADAARQAQGRWARLRAAWRGR
jgi:hypothetical protein